MTKTRSATSNYKKPVKIAAAINFQTPENLYQNASPSLKQHLNKKNNEFRNTNDKSRVSNNILQQSESSSDQQGDAARYSKHLLQISRVVTDIVPAKNKIVQSRQADFWLAKGFSQAQRGHFQSAIDCYKHGLRLDNSHFACSFNLGCCYEKMKKLRRALKWFHSASQSNPQSPQAFYALSICAYKLGMYDDSHEYILKARELQIAAIHNKSGNDSTSDVQKSIQQVLSGKQLFSHRTSENQEIKRLWFNIAYMCALCERKLKNYQQAGKQFITINDELKKRYGEFLKCQVFGMLLLPFQYDRQMLHENIKKLKSIEEYYSLQKSEMENRSSQQHPGSQNRRSVTKLSPGGRSPSKGIDRKNTYILGYGGQYQQSQSEVWKISSNLIKLSFFKRYTIEQLEKSIIPEMEIKKYDANSILFIQSDQVAVVISGVILMRCHRDSIVSPKFMAKYVSGDIIGYSPIDQGISRKHQNWFTVIGQAQIALFPVSIFSKIWELQKNIQSQIQRSVLQTHDVFRQFSIQSLYLLCYQLLQKRSFYQGELIAMQSKTSKFNNRFSQTFKPRVSSISISLKRIQQQRVAKDDQSRLESNTSINQNISPSPQRQITQSIRSPKMRNNRQSNYRGSIFSQSPSPFIAGGSVAGDNRSIISGKKSNIVISRRNSKNLIKIPQHPDDNDSEFQDQIKNKRKIRVKQTEIEDKLIMGGGGVSSGTTSIVSGFDRGGAGGLRVDQDLDLIQQRDGFEQYFEKGIYIVEKGHVFIENPIDGYNVTNVSRGDFFGEQQYFKENGFCHYGDIFAAQDEVICHFINFKSVGRIQNWEIQKLKIFSGARKSIEKLKYTCEMRYFGKNSISGKKIY